VDLGEKAAGNMKGLGGEFGVSLSSFQPESFVGAAGPGRGKNANKGKGVDDPWQVSEPGGEPHQ